MNPEQEAVAEIRKLMEKCDEVINAYGEVLERQPDGFDDDLPYKKEVICLALLRAMRSTNDDRLREAMVVGVISLFSFIPTPEQYSQLLFTNALSRTVRREPKIANPGEEKLKLLAKFSSKSSALAEQLRELIGEFDREFSKLSL